MAALLEMVKVVLEKYVTSLSSMPHSEVQNINFSRLDFLHIMHQKSKILVTLKCQGQKKSLKNISSKFSLCFQMKSFLVNHHKSYRTATTACFLQCITSLYFAEAFFSSKGLYTLMRDGGWGERGRGGGMGQALRRWKIFQKTIKFCFKYSRVTSQWYHSYNFKIIKTDSC